ncbi:hypothetical protein PsorP6_001930 [Peronosclerospora sorghi]|uniref:Uncharacterized protein n=1 Tax=Peronosclerospora sorghi TaxID=230839 RepID=A0ACC0WPL5_9STRA|nr:hypothetical protein PsorP6_001930 [Peronosclerospora sorghi]
MRKLHFEKASMTLRGPEDRKKLSPDEKNPTSGARQRPTLKATLHYHAPHKKYDNRRLALSSYTNMGRI